MQAGGQYGMPEVPQYVVGRGPPSHSHMFSLSHDMPLSPSSGHAHPQGHSPHPQHLHQQQQSQQHHHHHLQQQQPLPQPPHHSQTQQVQQQHVQSQQPQPPPQPPQQSQQLDQHGHQQSMVQQAGLGPASPEDPSPLACKPPLLPNNYNKSLVVSQEEVLTVEDQDEFNEEGEKGSAGNRWPRQEALSLLKIRSDMDASFRDSSLKGPLWEEVSRKLSEMGYHRSAKKCKEKFENVNKYYKRTKDGKAGRQDGKTYRFFSQLEALYGNSNGPSNTRSIKSSHTVLGGTAGASTGGGLGTGSGKSQEDRGGFPLLKGTATTTGAGEAADFAYKPDIDCSSGLNFSTDSSDDDYEDPGETENLGNKKRKRKSFRRFMSFFENLMKKLIDKQEQMQKKFLEALERKEHDRMIREEAWKRQEMARMSRDQELRAQERALAATRDSALVAFLQKVTGQSLQLPQITLPVQTLATVPDVHDDEFHEKASSDANSKRWPKPEVMTLIKLRTGMDPRFQKPGPKGPLWEETSAAMSNVGFNRSAKRCKEKWENINKYFKKAKESSKKRPEDAKTCPYFHELDALYKKGLLGSSQNKQAANKIDDPPGEELLEQSNGSNQEDLGEQAQRQILAIMSAEDHIAPPTAVPPSNGPVVRFFSSPPENGNGVDPSIKKGTLSQ